MQKVSYFPHSLLSRCFFSGPSAKICFRSLSPGTNRFGQEPSARRLPMLAFKDLSGKHKWYEFRCSRDIDVCCGLWSVLGHCCVATHDGRLTGINLLQLWQCQPDLIPVYCGPLQLQGIPLKIHRCQLFLVFQLPLHF
jgi:hypothetical protein